MTRHRKDRIWLALTPGKLAQTLVSVLESEAGDRVTAGPDMPAGSEIGIVVADQEHAHAIALAHGKAADSFQSVLITPRPDAAGEADFILTPDVDPATLVAIVRIARDFQEEVAGLRSDVASRRSAVGTIMSGQFEFRTLEEARNLATMLALACPNSDLVAVGLQELLVNAVEHGNLEIGAQEKQDLLLTGEWRAEVEKRLADPRYAHRRVIVNFKRGRRMISLTIQDDGEGFDHSALDAEEGATTGYRGRGVALARSLSFASVTYLGSGNLVEATILLDGQTAQA
ncbi:ATP-binding protein [Maricaulis parjimensis]|uniref:ATP-binding protein n=1 Tax=Maricaulis parjimensis TaxID=144023 RepID=UPI00193951A8|nr:ATP-binding protein [Maricaulis parjimensis]